MGMNPKSFQDGAIRVMGFVRHLPFDPAEWSWDVLLPLKASDISIIPLAWGFGMDWHVKVDAAGRLQVKQSHLGILGLTVEEQKQAVIKARMGQEQTNC